MDKPFALGCYRRLLVVVRHGGAWPAVAVDYASAWATRDAVANVVMLPGTVHEDATTQGVGRACGADVAMAYTVRCALLARGLEATESFVPRVCAGSSVRDSIAQTANRWGADIVLTDYPCPAHLAQAAACNVLYLPADGSHRFHVPPHRVFVASDESASALCAVEEARRIAGPEPQLRRAYVSFNPDGGKSLGPATVVLAAAHHGDNLAHAILQAAHEWGADLLVLGTHGPVPQARWRFGSVAGDVALFTDMPLLLVPENR
ncbi:universal stress protein [Paraburkholderia hospita]|uniref:universal stress protein n=1 Tax=Paraburkholderia hospita TaxID=169430 RepID=UPI0014047B6D|nr:universal stress protein [Paraburkholderia hospita]